jgi:hypothetical protein
MIGASSTFKGTAARRFMDKETGGSAMGRPMRRGPQAGGR